MRTLANSPQNYPFRCDKCQFISDNKKDYRRHTLSAKHAKRTGANISAANLPVSEPNPQTQTSHTIPQIHQSYPAFTPVAQHAFVFEKHIYKYCEKCGNKYHSKSGLWKHRKTCEGVSASPPPVASATTPDQDFKTIIMDMLKNNQEFQHKLMEMMCSQQSLMANAAANAVAAAATAASATPANYTNNNNYNGTTNSHNNNNTFNLKFFLNEQCKDAMNINEFANTIHLKDSDLDEFGRMGYVEGMSKLFIDSLKQTDVFKRPIHCSDARRETLYVKDADKWEREGPENTTITNAVRVVEHKNIVLVNEWAKQNPRCEDSTTMENAQYISMSRAVLDGDDRNIAKVIKNVAKEVLIEKPQC
jgi:hypothetical protein